MRDMLFLRVIVSCSALLGAVAEKASAQQRVGCLAVIENISGGVEVSGPDGARAPARIGQWLCAGDTVITGGAAATGGSVPVALRLSQVELRFAEQGKLVRLGGNTALALPAADEAARRPVLLVRGILYVASTVRSFFAVETAYMTAGIDGTEATVHHVPGVGAVVAVREGVVRAARPGAPPGAAALQVAQDGVAFAAPGAAPRAVGPADAAGLPPVFRRYVARPEAAVDWAAYYPAPLLAAAADEPQTAAAARLIAEGRPEAARRALDCAGAAARRDGRAAVCAMLAALLDSPGDDGLAAWAAAADAAGAQAGSPQWRIAQSYVMQALGRLEDARPFAAAARAAAPQDAYAAARLAEIDLLLGDAAAALALLEPLVPAGPACGAAIAHVHAVLGFARLAAWRFDAARDSFACAIARDPAAPLGRLGLGLARIRQGDMAGGTADLEAAVLLDPGAAASRVWLGRAYLEAGRFARAEAHLDLARREDPDDPTPHLFRSMLRFSRNDPIGALDEIETARALAPARATVRSFAGLGEDRAVLGAAIGRVYDVLGFRQLAISEGAFAAESEPASPAAMGFLASALRTRPGAETARASAQLRADLLTPPTASPFQPELGARNLALLDTPGASRVTFAEFAPLFDADGVRFYGAGLGGTQKTFGDEISVAALSGRVSLAFGQFLYDTDGYRANNDVRHEILAAQGRARIAPGLTLFAEYRHRETEAGDRSLEFDFADVNAELRTTLDEDRYRLGAAWRPDAETTALALGTWFDSAEFVRKPDYPDLGRTAFTVYDSSGYDIALEASRAFSGFRATIGVSANEIETRTTEFFKSPRRTSRPRFSRNTTAQRTLYGYFDFSPAPWLDATLGMAIESYKLEQRGGGFERTRATPRIGLRADLGRGVVARAALTGGIVRRDLAAETLDRPTLMGFEQTSTDFAGVYMQRAGLGADWRPDARTWIGAEIVQTELDQFSFRAKDQTVQEARAYVNRAFGGGFVGSVAVEYAHVRAPNALVKLDRSDTLSIPLRLAWFHRSGLFVAGEAAFLRHDFETDADTGRPRSGSDDSVVVNASLGFRFPDRRGVVSLELLNILDARPRVAADGLRFNQIRAPRYAPSFTALLRATLAF